MAAPLPEHRASSGVGRVEWRALQAATDRLHLPLCAGEEGQSRRRRVAHGQRRRVRASRRLSGGGRRDERPCVRLVSHHEVVDEMAATVGVRRIGMPGGVERQQRQRPGRHEIHRSVSRQPSSEDPDARLPQPARQLDEPVRRRRSVGDGGRPPAHRRGGEPGSVRTLASPRSTSTAYPASSAAMSATSGSSSAAAATVARARRRMIHRRRPSRARRC